MLREEKTSLNTIIKNNTFFAKAIEKLTLGGSLERVEKEFLLSAALLFVNEYNKDKRYKSYADLAYFIILKYSINYSDYKPLYDFATVFGFYPITNSILENNLLPSDNLNDCFTKIQLQNFMNTSDDGRNYIETFEQNDVREKFITDQSIEKGFIAPTSFGKSSIIIEFIKSLASKQKIVIIVPTKSLLMQTHKMIREGNLKYKILIHDEMYSSEKEFIAIFTQERALRLMKKKQIIYDAIIVDEAHNILNKNNRSILLSRLLRLNRNRNINQQVIYLSPLIDNINNLKIHKDQNLKSHQIEFNIKSPQIFEYKKDNTIVSHNRFFINKNNLGFVIGEYSNYFNYVLDKAGEKTFIYSYRPVHIEKLAKQIATLSPTVTQNQKLEEVIKILKQEVHDKFYCVDYLKRGVIYLHGKIPDLIKEYLEKKFNDIENIKFIIANTVILEGINLPIDKLFVFNTRGLDGKALTNLIGRVNRLNKIFSPGNNLQKLLPEVHFINNELNGENSDMFNKIKSLRNRTFSDEIDNPLLQEFRRDKLKDDTEDNKKKKDRIEKLITNEDFLLEESGDPRDKLKQYFIENEFNLFYNNIDQLTDSILPRLSLPYFSSIDWNKQNLIEKIFILFIKEFIGENGFIADFEFYRLKDQKARNYYEIIIKNRKKSLKQNIIILFNHLKKRKASTNKKDHLYYIGSSYGEQKYQSDKYFDELRNHKVAIDLFEKNDQQLANYAIVKLKMEEDFINYKLNKFIIFLYDYNLITESEYNEYVYGTNDQFKIALTKYGLNIGLVERLSTDNQLTNLTLDEYNNLSGNSKFKEYLKTLNDFQQFEIERFIN